jgi:hypothetical protein
MLEAGSKSFADYPVVPTTPTVLDHRPHDSGIVEAKRKFVARLTVLAHPEKSGADQVMIAEANTVFVKPLDR